MTAGAHGAIATLGSRAARHGHRLSRSCAEGAKSPRGGRSSSIGRFARYVPDRRGANGVQSEHKRGQLRATHKPPIRCMPPHRTGSLRLGAGRSQVQILSPRSEVPGNRALCFPGALTRRGARVQTGCNCCNRARSGASLRGADSGTFGCTRLLRSETTTLARPRVPTAGTTTRTMRLVSIGFGVVERRELP
jgi:hypothetical protein